jgi:ankyrin repeat protein
MEVEDALEKLPKGEYAYRQAYDEAMEKRIKGQKPGFSDLALRTLSWVTLSKRPLTTSELQHALAVTDGASTLNPRNLRPIGLITSVCAGLVTVDEERDIIRLVHYTTQEYFDQTWATWFPNGQTDIAKTCVTYLSFKAFETGISHTNKDFEARLKSNILYAYAAQNWGHHARMSSIEGGKLILDFLESTTKVSASSQAMMYMHGGYGRRSQTQMIGIHLAAYFGLEESMSALLHKNTNIESTDGYNRTPLSWASSNGHEAVVKLMLGKNADVESSDSTGQTPLSWAAEKGHEAVVKLLLDKNADIESSDRTGQTPLSSAAENGHEPVVKLLLDKNADVESNSIGQTPLSWAARNGHEAVVKLLLDKNADTESGDFFLQTPLSWASQNGHEAVVKLLLDKNADTESSNFYRQTPLLWASQNGHEAVVKLLLDKNADIESMDFNGQKPLSSASQNGHEAVVKLLLDKNADIKSKDTLDRTPLSWGTKKGP